MGLFEIDQLRRYRYKVARCIINAGGEAIPLNSMCVTGLMIMDDYVKNVFPIFRLNLICDSSTYYKISQFKETLRVHLVIHKYYTTRNNSGTITKTSPMEACVNESFSVISSEVSIEKDKDLDIQNDIHGADTGDNNLWNHPVELYLYRNEIANGLKQKLNAVLKNTNLTSAVTWALSESGIKNCVMSPLENGKRYETIFIPPLPINKLIQHLDAMYGFYKKGAMIYFGVKRSYILNFKGGCTAYENNEKKETCILVPKLTDPLSGNDGGCVSKGDNKNYIFCKYENMEFSNPSVIENITSGNDSVVINSALGTTDSSKSNAKSTNNRSNTQIVTNRTLNQWISSILTALANSRSINVSIAMYNADIDSITPNKLFTMALEDPSMSKDSKGQYILTKAIHTFMNDRATGDFSLVSGIELRKL